MVDGEVRGRSVRTDNAIAALVIGLLNGLSILGHLVWHLAY